MIVEGRVFQARQKRQRPGAGALLNCSANGEGVRVDAAEQEGGEGVARFHRAGLGPGVQKEREGVARFRRAGLGLGVQAVSSPKGYFRSGTGSRWKAGRRRNVPTSMGKAPLGEAGRSRKSTRRGEGRCGRRGGQTPESAGRASRQGSHSHGTEGTRETREEGCCQDSSPEGGRCLSRKRGSGQTAGSWRQPSWARPLWASPGCDFQLAPVPAHEALRHLSSENKELIQFYLPFSALPRNFEPRAGRCRTA